MSSKLIHNAVLRSFHEGFDPGGADALFIEDDRIRALGQLADLENLAGPETERIDAAGRILMPGLHDTHIHIWKVGNLRTYLLDVREASSLDDLLARLSAYARQYPEVAWITARGFNEGGWEDSRMPTRQDLDRVSADRPIYLIRTCAHIAVCNTLALEKCGLSAATPVPEGGMVYTGNDGRPNGILSETALGLVTPFLPSYSKEELKTMVRAARDEFYRYGITAATDPAVDPLLLEAYREMNAAGELGMRLQAIPILLPDGGVEPYPVPSVFDSPHLSIRYVKFFSDGGLSGRTAALIRPYPGRTADGPPEHGILRLDLTRYAGLCREAARQGLGIATHAIGDAAIRQVIDVYSQLRADFAGLPLRIEHLGLPHTTDLENMARQRIATSMQTIFLTELGRNFRQHLDETYLEHCYPVRSVLRHGILTALSSDGPVVRNINPFKGMEAAITRKDADGVLISPHEGISIGQAAAAYTSSAAAISGLPEIGSLKEGNYADLILVDRDPLSTPPNQLADIRVEKTFVGGVCVWKR